MVKQENDSVFAEVLDSVGQNMVITGLLEDKLDCKN